jgi:hypothetical protein
MATAEMKEVQEFDKRFGEKPIHDVVAKYMITSCTGMWNGTSLATARLFGGTPGAADAFAQMQKDLTSSCR